MKMIFNEINLFYQTEFLPYGIKLPVSIRLSSHPHILCVGSTGSGKTTAVKYILAKCAKSTPNMKLTLCDFKNFDFVEFAGCKRHFAYKNCVEGIEQFYAEFQADLQAGNRDTNCRKILFIDEYSSFLLSQEKKEAERIKSMISELLFLGRSYQYSIFIALQRADSEFFKSGSRDQMGAILMLGNLSKEQKSMLASDYKDEMTENCARGQGYFLKDGERIYRVTIPFIHKFDKMHAIIKDALSC